MHSFFIRLSLKIYIIGKEIRPHLEKDFIHLLLFGGGLFGGLLCCWLLCRLFGRFGFGCLLWLSGLFGGLGLLGCGFLSLLGGLCLLGLLGLGLLSLLGLLGLRLLFLDSLVQFERSLNLDQFLGFDQLFDGFTEEGGNFDDVNLVVGSDVFLDGGKGGSLGALQGLDGSHNHSGGWGMGRLGLWLCSLFGGLCGGFRHFEIKKWRC